MRQRSETWAKLAIRGRFSMETVAVIDGVTYTTISAPVIDRALLSDELAVGNCITSSLKLSVLTENEIPQSASVIIKARIYSGETVSEWLEFGTFYISKRSENNGLISLQCFDAMLKCSQNCVDPSDPQSRIGWPKSMKRVVEEIAERIGVEIDPRTAIKTTDPYQMSYPTNYTMQQVLGFIGACHGGNWIITPENKLRLIPIVTPPAETFDIVDYEYNKIYTTDGYKLVWRHVETEEEVVNPAGGEVINVPIVIGKITTEKRRKISRVTLARDDTLGYTLGDNTGLEVRIESNPCASQAICDDLFAALNGVEYAPFAITKACYDPCTELGDWILVGDKVRSTIYVQKLTFGTDFRVDASAPGKDENSTEYPYLTEIQKLHHEDERLKVYMEDAKDQITSRIEQTYTSILLEVAGTYATKDEVSSSIALTAESIDAEVKRSTEADEELSGRLTITESSIEAEVRRATETEEELSGRLSLTESSLSAEITRAVDEDTRLSTTIEATATSIRTEVTETAAALESGYTSAIEQLAKSITLSVTNGEDSSVIQLTGDGIETQSKTIKFTGDVVFKSNLTDGQTTISGDNITTGNLNADLITTGNLNANLIVSGKIQSKNGRVYFDLDKNELHCDTLISTDTSTTWIGNIIAKIGILDVSMTSGYRQTRGLVVYDKDNAKSSITLSPSGGEERVGQLASWGDCALIKGTDVGIGMICYPYNGWRSGLSGITMTPKGHIVIGANVEGNTLTPDYIESNIYDEGNNYDGVYNFGQGTIAIQSGIKNLGDNSYSQTSNILFRASKACFSNTIQAITLHARLIYDENENSTNPSLTIVASSLTTNTLWTKGEKTRVVETKDYDNRLLYCYEMPSPMFGDIGEGKTDSAGICIISFDDIFAETITTSFEYQVFIQKEGEGDLWILEKDINTFTVVGTPNLKFAWEVKIRQRDYEGLRLEEFENQITASKEKEEIDYAEEGAKLVSEYIRLMEGIAYEEVNQLY